MDNETIKTERDYRRALKSIEQFIELSRTSHRLIRRSDPRSPALIRGKSSISD
jgi:hypothetical protein